VTPNQSLLGRLRLVTGRSGDASQVVILSGQWRFAHHTNPR